MSNLSTKPILSKKLDFWIVEDDPITMLLTKKVVLSIYRDLIQISEFRDGEEATIALANHKKCLPDLIFLDLNMPIMDGWDFLNYVAENGFKNSLKVVVLSSSIDHMDMDRALSFEEVTAYIPKPLNLENLNRINLIQQTG